MNKPWYKSKTVWGGIFLSLEAVILTLPAGTYHAVVAGVGTFLTVFGFRDAMK